MKFLSPPDTMEHLGSSPPVITVLLRKVKSMLSEMQMGIKWHKDDFSLAQQRSDSGYAVMVMRTFQVGLLVCDNNKH